MKFLSAAIAGLAGLAGVASAAQVSSHNVFHKMMGDRRVSALSTDPISKALLVEIKAASELANSPLDALRGLESMIDGLVDKYSKNAEADLATYSAERVRRLEEYNELSQKRGLHSKEIDASHAKIEANSKEIARLNEDLKAAQSELETISHDRQKLEESIIRGTEARTEVHDEYLQRKNNLVGDLKDIRTALKNLETGDTKGAVAFIESKSGVRVGEKKSLIEAALASGHLDVVLELIGMLRVQYDEDVFELTHEDTRLAAIWEQERSDLVNQLAQNRLTIEDLGKKAIQISDAVAKLSEENNQLSQVIEDRVKQGNSENQTVDDKLAIIADNAVAFEAKRQRNDRRLYTINLIRTVLDDCLSNTDACMSSNSRPNLRPHSCLEHRLNGKRVDGEYQIFADNATDKAITVWCTGMATEVTADWSADDAQSNLPRFKSGAHAKTSVENVALEYLSVVPEHNFAIMYSGRQLNGWDCDGNLSNELYRFGGHQTFSKIRYDVRRRALIPNDWNYAIKNAEEGTNVPLGTAGDCFSWSKCPKGSFEIDLSGTPFHFPENVKDYWQTAGFAVSADIQLSDGNKRLSGVCGGWCGVCSPADEIPLELDQ